MKRTKRLFGVLLAFVMVLAMAVTSYGATLKIEDADEDQTYTAYKIFNVTETDGNYEYTITSDSAWYSVIANSGYFNLVAKSTDEDSVTTYVVTLKSSYDNDDAEEIAKYLADRVPSGADALTFEDGTLEVENGYYLIITSLGTNLVLNTYDEDETIDIKNEAPTITKIIDDGSADGAKDASYSIGDTVGFIITINAKDGAAAYEVVDVLSEGMTYDSTSLRIIDNNNYALVENTDYTVVVSTTGDNDTQITITFDAAYLDTLDDDDTITITYSATVNANATTGVDKESNEVTLYYGDESTVTDKVTVDTFGFTLKKTNSNGEALSGAVFTLQDDDGNYIIVDSATGYVKGKSSSESYISLTNVSSLIIYGLAAGTYTLTETAAPEGYNLLSGSVKITINETNGSITVDVNGDQASASDGTVTVVNNSGKNLPSTGGMGTTILYIAGIALVLFAGVMLITRRRMSR